MCVSIDLVKPEIGGKGKESSGVGTKIYIYESRGYLGCVFVII